MMKTFALVLVFLAFSADAVADTSDILASNNRTLMQVISTSVDYREFGNGYLGTPTGVLDTETGSVMGGAISLSGMRGGEHLYWEFGGDYSAGETRYTGALQGGTFGSYVGSSGAQMINLGIRLGKGFAVGDRTMLSPYGEWGWHEWQRGVNYGERYSHQFFGAGLMAQYSPVPRLVLSVSALWARTNQSSIEVNSGPNLTGFTGRLGDSPLYRIGAAVDYAFTSQIHGNLAVEYTKFRYGASAAFPVGSGLVAWEPDSETRYLVIRTGLAIPF
jgi:hypothetical protein